MAGKMFAQDDLCSITGTHIKGQAWLVVYAWSPSTGEIEAGGLLGLIS